MIRFAQEKDIPKIGDLLCQVDLVHHQGRPDLFKIGRKYTDEELKIVLQDSTRPILVAVDDADRVLGYCFCMLQQHIDDHVLTDVKTLYMDDLCVDAACRGQHIGKGLYEAAVDLAKRLDCYNLTLNVWSCNPSAQRFYESLGMSPQKIGMEQILR